MGELQLHFQKGKQYEDLSEEPFVYEYPAEEEIGGHRFRHLAHGIYLAEPSFEATAEEMSGILREYRDITLLCNILVDEKDGERRKRKTEVLFAYSQTYVELEDPSMDYESLAEKEPELAPYAAAWEQAERESWFRHQSFRITDEEEAPLPPLREAMRCRLPSSWYRENDAGEQEMRKRIMLRGYVGDMVEEGIYYFGRGKLRDPWKPADRPVVSILWNSEKKVAALCTSTDFHPSPDVAVVYLAMEEKYFPRLMQIMKEGERKLFYVEFLKKQTEAEARDPDERVRIEYPFLEKMAEEEQGPEKAPERIPIADAAKELVEGLGFYDLEISYKTPLTEAVAFREYDAAYKLGNELVLVEIDTEGVHERRYDMRLMELLLVRRKQRLRCGIDYPAVYRVIDCREERLREILTPEAYRIFTESYEAGM